ncbi:MAG: lipoate--protein ligase family protein [Armatimonadetes bacterium]|nr:lipoate--protein ligase family protein [Armatimonadota bacterium]
MMVWRLIYSEPLDGPANMAVDEAIMRAVADGDRPPTLRLYSWRPPALSLGYNQPSSQGIDIAECARRGFDVVRRPTGGRAILHADELTYSVCVRQDEIPGGHSTMDSYRHISRGIIAGLERLGAKVSLGDDGDAHRSGVDRTVRAMCFAKTARCDLQAAGRKIVGSAQVRRDGAILQHGSIPLTIDLEAQGAVMPGESSERAAARALAGAAMSVSELLGRPVSFEELSEAIVAGFADALGVEFTPDALSPDEEDLAARLRAEKYADDAFTRRL